MTTELRMAFPRQLTEAIFLERPNRFIIHCRLLDSDEVVIAHLPDPGRLIELLIPGRRVWLMDNDNPNRNTKWTAVLCENPDQTCLVSINTTYPNMLVEKGLKAGFFEEFNDWKYKKSEYKHGNSRWDFLLEKEDGNQLLLEVKSVTLADGEKGMFPDAVTARGTKHVKELTELARNSDFETAILFVAQREDVQYITTASHIDPAFDQALREAEAAGVRLFARRCQMTVEEIRVVDSISVDLAK
ncbi:DNA/RNA nuclease SfsA [Robertmurraya kyonggiensis]|uniref:Sugar fermentation stimulation protein homolog n=1 Tax=Robertmurraya kyonggiensis TaxID=1037680 RepID=A0A4U1CZK8_9BACI|nr:DNA/RNA nuclease SfsA [Robertmurraya kyonggiensis]TKC14853.1 DNA/RNA nuclease SfsA [Robertmurraya kyonggiensis]